MSRPPDQPDEPDEPEPLGHPELPRSCLADITYRLMTGFASSVDRSVITRIVRACHRELRRAHGRNGSDDGVAVPELLEPELLERRARESLAALIENGSAGVVKPVQLAPP